MSDTETPKTTSRVASLKVRGRSFMALVLTPEAPVTEWLVSLDAEIARASMFFVERPVVLDAGLLTDGDETGLIEALAERGIRVIAAENAPPTLTGLPAPLAGGRSTGDLEVPDPSADAPPPPPPPRALLVEQTVRSGQQVVHPEGDVTIIGGVASGAEVMAGGSIHVYGALRGRAVAGFGGHRGARILCRKLHAELLAIDGFYMTADDMDAGLVGTPVMVQLDGEHLTITGME